MTSRIILKLALFSAAIVSASALAQNVPDQLPVGPVSGPAPVVPGPTAPAASSGPVGPVISSTGPQSSHTIHPTTLTPEEQRAAEGLTAQVAQQYANASGAPSFDAPRPKPRSNVKPPPENITVKVGQNAVFGIAEGHLNRLVTPFKNPVIKTTAVAATSIEKNIVYVSTNNSEPVGFYIHDAADPLNAISVTMVPADIPPISVNLNLEGYTGHHDGGEIPSAADPKLAKGWETGQPFLETLKTTFKDIAKGTIPDGYSFDTVAGFTRVMPRCSMPGLRIEPRQLLTGFNVQVVVAKIENPSDFTVDVNEQGCEGDSVLAVAAWPSSSVPPHGASELYVAVRKQDETNQDVVRPSLIGGL